MPVQDFTVKSKIEFMSEKQLSYFLINSYLSFIFKCLNSKVSVLKIRRKRLFMNRNCFARFNYSFLSSTSTLERNVRAKASTENFLKNSNYVGY